MNENNNELNNSNAPYKAVNNLNTIIDNPNININSTMTSNIMESSGFDDNQVNNQQNSGLSVSSSIMGQQVEENSEILQNKDSIGQYFNKNQSENQQVSNPSVLSNLNSVIDNEDNSNIDNNVSNNNFQYENVYQSNSKVAKNKVSFKIPGEFKTALIIVIALLILLTLFDNFNAFINYIRNLFHF